MGRKKKYYTQEERDQAKKKYDQNYLVKWRKENMGKMIQYKNKLIARRKIWFYELRQSMFCIDCELKDWRVLDFHHRDPSTKKYLISKMVNSGLSEENILAEIEKCDVICANCHRIRHYNRGGL